MSRYFCHNCNIRLDRVNDDFTCPTCSGGFVEELDESQESQQQDFLPGLGQAPFNPLDFLQLIGLNPLGQQSQQHQRQPRSQSHPSSPTGSGGSGAGIGGLSGGTPSTLAGAATASAAAAANSQSTQNARSRSRSRGGGGGGPGIWTHHTPHFSFVIDGRQVHGLGGGGGGGGVGGQGGGGTGGEPGVENMFMSFLSDLITGLGGGIPVTGNINLGDYAWGREGLDAIVTQLMNNMEGTGPPPMTEEKIALLIRIQITSEQVDAKLQCSVCWEDFKLSENVIRLECEHIFHPDCILPWLKLHATCPVCRKDLNGMNSEEVKEESRMTDSMNNPQPAAAAAAAASTSASSSSTNRPFYDEDMEFD